MSFFQDYWIYITRNRTFCHEMYTSLVSNSSRIYFPFLVVSNILITISIPKHIHILFKGCQFCRLLIFKVIKKISVINTDGKKSS